jgi:hypothetical protein
MLCDVIVWRGMLGYVLFCYVMLCYAMLCYVMLCYMCIYIYVCIYIQISPFEFGITVLLALANMNQASAQDLKA